MHPYGWHTEWPHLGAWWFVFLCEPIRDELWPPITPGFFLYSIHCVEVYFKTSNCLMQPRSRLKSQSRKEGRNSLWREMDPCFLFYHRGNTRDCAVSLWKQSWVWWCRVWHHFLNEWEWWEQKCVLIWSCTSPQTCISFIYQLLYMIMSWMLHNVYRNNGQFHRNIMFAIDRCFSTIISTIGGVTITDFLGTIIEK